MIEVHKVTKNFGFSPVLKDVSFKINHGEIVGVLGQNGAGKTTLMRLLTSYLSPTSGEIYVFGKDIQKYPSAILKRIGYLPEVAPLYPQMTVKAYLKFAAQLKSVPFRQQRLEVARVLEACDLHAVRNKTIGILSKGYKQRIGIAQAILNNPEILILDEPTSGLDPIQILQVRKLIRNFDKKCTVILSTHILFEIEQLAQRVIIIKQGEVAADDSLSGLKKNFEGFSLEDVFLKIHGVSISEARE